MAVLRAVKLNKQLKIEASQVKSYQDAGYDIYDGETLTHHGAGKTVPYAEYQAVLDEVAKLKAELDKAKAEAEKAAKALAEAKANEDDKAKTAKTTK